MTISYGDATKKLTIYPPTKPSSNHEIPLWVENEDNDEENIQQLFMVDLSLVFKEKYDDDLICDAIIDPKSHTNDVVQMFMEGFSSSLVKNEYNHMPFIYISHLQLPPVCPLKLV
jgi:hypothetical protein